MKIIAMVVLIIATQRAETQIMPGEQQLDVALAAKISISGFCLCKVTVSELKDMDSELTETAVEEMDMCKNKFVQDARFVNGNGYYSRKNPGIIFQKENVTDLISKIRLTRDFRGNLPDGKFIDMSKLTARDVLKMYPTLDTWKSRGCSDYWSLTNDTISFFIKIDKTRVPQYPVDETYYLDKPVEGVDLVISCSGVFNKKAIFHVNENNPVFFVDGIKAKDNVPDYFQPSDVAFINVYKGENALKVAGEEGINGVIFITTKAFARNQYWSYFRSKSVKYKKLIPNLDSEARVLYILNGKKLEKDFERTLFDINDETFLELTVVRKGKRMKQYQASKKQTVVLIRTQVEE